MLCMCVYDAQKGKTSPLCDECIPMWLFKMQPANSQIVFFFVLYMHNQKKKKRNLISLHKR